MGAGRAQPKSDGGQMDEAILALDKTLVEKPCYPLAFMLKFISNHYKT
jgi:hypothetical protein